MRIGTLDQLDISVGGTRIRNQAIQEEGVESPSKVPKTIIQQKWVI